MCDLTYFRMFELITNICSLIITIQLPRLLVAFEKAVKSENANDADWVKRFLLNSLGDY